MLLTSTSLKGFRLGDHYPGVYLGHTELRILIALLKGRSLKQIAFELNIASRSVDYYCFNMMRLMGFTDLEALIHSLKQHAFFSELSR